MIIMYFTICRTFFFVCQFLLWRFYVLQDNKGISYDDVFYNGKYMFVDGNLLIFIVM